MTIKTKRERPWWLPWLIGCGTVLVLLEGDLGDFRDAALARAGYAWSIPEGNRAEALRTLLRDGTSFRCALAIRHLIESGLSKEEAMPVVSREFERFTSQTPASYALAKTGVPALPWLIEALKSETIRVRQQAAVTLGDIGVPARSAVPDLRELAARRPSDESVVAARNALFDVAPEGTSARLWKVWYELDGEAAFALLVGFLAFAIAIRNKIKGIRLPVADEDADETARPPRALVLCLGLAGLAFGVFALVDLLGPRWTTSADTTALALAAWAFAGALFSS
jgi:hypothetical protein